MIDPDDYDLDAVWENASYRERMMLGQLAHRLLEHPAYARMHELGPRRTRFTVRSCGGGVLEAVITNIANPDETYSLILTGQEHN